VIQTIDGVEFVDVTKRFEPREIDRTEEELGLVTQFIGGVRPRRRRRATPTKRAGKVVDTIAGVPVYDETPTSDDDFHDETMEGRSIIFVGWQAGATIVERTEELPGVTIHYVRPLTDAERGKPPPKRKAKRPAPKRSRRS